MGHMHVIRDTDTHFTINPITRQIRNDSSRKITLIQGDHNSERFTFELPRYIEGHDMSLCNKVEVHFLNVDRVTNAQNPGVYTVDDLQIHPDDPDKVLCSWLISKNATKLIGSLNFLVKFSCIEGTITTYAWHTGIHIGISISDGINGGDALETTHLDIIEQWKATVIRDITADVNAGVTEWEEAESVRLRAILAENNSVQNARIDQILTGATADDAELVDIRVGADGVTYDSAGTAVREQITSVQSILDGVDNLINANQFAAGVNKFNINDHRIRENVFLNHTGYVESAGYAVTHPIYVKKGCIYKMPFTDSMGTNNNMAFTDINGNFISVEKGVIVDGYITFTPSKSGYAAFNLGNRSGTKESFMVCLADEYPGEYVAFIDPFEHPITNPLHGKIITFNGDSICAGAGFAGGYGKIIAESNGMIYQNIAVGGGTITAETYSGEVKRHWVCRTIENMRTDADYAILEGGVNDAALRIPLGSLSDGYSAELDDTTFIGAFESMLKQLVVRFAGKKIGYIAVHKMTTKYDSRYPENSYYYAAKECCEKWGVPYLDLNVQVPPLCNITALKEAFTANADGWHPNEAGYTAYYVPKIEAWLKTL